MKLLKKLALIRKRKAIQRIRKESAFWGYPLDDLSDEQLEERILGFAKIISNTGVSMDEAIAALGQVSRVLMKINGELSHTGIDVKKAAEGMRSTMDKLDNRAAGDIEK